MGTLRRALIGVALACTVIGAQTPSTLVQTPPPTPEQQAIDQLIKDADTAARARDLDTMMRLADEVIGRSRAIDDKDRLAQGLSAKGRAFFGRQQHKQCADTLREALGFVDAIRSPNVQFTVASNGANCLQSSNALDEAVVWQQRAGQLARSLNNPGLEAQVTGNTALTFLLMGEISLAKDWAQRAVTMSTAAHDDTRRAFGMAIFATAHFWDLEPAIPLFRQAIAAYDQLPASPATKLQAAINVASLAAVEAWAGHNGDAIRDADEYLARDAAIGANVYSTMANAIAAKGLAKLHLGRLDEAETDLRLARATWTKTATDSDVFVSDQMLTELILAQVLRAKGRASDAEDTLQGVLSSFDRLRTGRLSASALEIGAAAVYKAFSELADMRIAAGRFVEAFDLSERFRARAFLDLLDEQRRGENGMTPAQRAREAALAAQAVPLQLKVLSPGATAADIDAARDQLRTIDLALDALRNDVRRTVPQSGFRFTALKTAADIQAALPADTAVLSYVTGSDRSLVFGVTSTRLVAHVLPADTELQKITDAFISRISTRPAAGASRDAALRRESARVSTTVLGPVADILNGKTRLIVLPDGPLNTLPFEALTLPQGGATPPWIAQRFTVSYAPSMSAFAALTGRSSSPSPTGATLFAMADPLVAAPASATRGPEVPFTPLPFTRIEVERIARIFGDHHTLVGGDATAAAVLTTPLERYRYIHLAGHAFVNTTRPGRSGLVLAPAKGDAGASILQADDIQTLRLNADMVTLSACSTAQGRSVSHEGVMSLARAFLIAGSKSVAASLWNVNDEATATLMERFYTQLKAGKPRDEALSAARRALISGSDTRLKDPYYWAPFILIGASR